MKKRLRYYLLFSMIIVILVLGAIVVVKLMATSPGCNYDDPGKSYINKNPNCIINFLCIQGRAAFSDECGCGCKAASP